MGWFDGRSSMEKKTAVMNAVVVMGADGRIDDKELAFLFAICKRVGMSEAELKEIIDDPSSVKFTVPTDPNERASMLIDIVFMMMVDGNIDRREMDLCMQIASRLGYKPVVVPKLVGAVIDAIKQGKSREQVGFSVDSYLGG